MSLARQIAARMLAKRAAGAAPKKSVMGSLEVGAAGAPAAETGSKSERASGTQPRHLPTRALEPAPPVPMAERRRRIAAGHARRNEPAPPPAARRGPVLSAPRGELICIKPPPLPPVPPRAELEFDLVKGLEAMPLPVAAAASPTTTGTFRGSCKAICADTGLQCRLPAHPGDPDRHRNERGPFHRVAAPGQSFTRRELLAQAATRHNPEAP